MINKRNKSSGYNFNVNKTKSYWVCFRDGWKATDAKRFPALSKRKDAIKAEIRVAYMQEGIRIKLDLNPVT